MVGAAGPVISCFPHELQYRVPELNGFPQASQYMFLPPSGLAADQYYVPQPKMFQAPPPYALLTRRASPPFYPGHFPFSRSKHPSIIVLSLTLSHPSSIAEHTFSALEI